MSHGQSRSASLFETLTSTVAGFRLSVWVQRLLFPSLGHELLLAQNLLAASVFTTVCVIRGYIVRRIFNACRDDLP